MYNKVKITIKTKEELLETEGCHYNEYCSDIVNDNDGLYQFDDECQKYCGKELVAMVVQEGYVYHDPMEEAIGDFEPWIFTPWMVSKVTTKIN